jgi:hypothetical protein
MKRKSEKAPDIVGELQSYAGSWVLVQLSSHHGKYLVQIRRWFPSGAGDFRPSKQQGIAIPLSKLRELGLLIRRAIKKAERAGILEREAK